MTSRPNLPAQILLVCLALGWVSSAQAQSEPVDRGQPLQFWVKQASASGGRQDVDTTVGALSDALANDPNVKRAAGDALALLGPKALPALPAMIAQFGHTFPWLYLRHADLLLCYDVRASERTDWFHEAGWGVMTHYLGAPPSSAGGKELTAEMWNEQIDAFDAEGLADQLAACGARYLLFTIGQNSGHYCAPNATYDKFVGISPSKCSRRDLVADLAKELKERNIRLLVYLPSGAPAADEEARKKLGWRWGRPGGWQLPDEPVGGRLAEFQQKWEAVIREWSLRWKADVSGWWIDGCYFADEMYRFDDEPNFASFAAALRAGNPDAIVAFNPGVEVPVVVHTKHEDYTAGEVTLGQLPQAVETLPGRWLEREGVKVQSHLLTFLGQSWCQGERPEWPDEKIAAIARQVREKGGVATYDVPILRSGRIPESFIPQLRAIGNSMK